MTIVTAQPPSVTVGETLTRTRTFWLKILFLLWDDHYG